MEAALTPVEALKLAVENAGGQSALARVCKVSQPTVWKWVQSSKRLPAEYVLSVEAATGVSRHWLRPDIYPVDLPPAQSRFVGIDRRVPSRVNGLDRRTGRVALDNRLNSKGAVL